MGLTITTNNDVMYSNGRGEASMKLIGIELRAVQRIQDGEDDSGGYMEVVVAPDQLLKEPGIPVLYGVYLLVQLDEQHTESRWMEDYGTAEEARRSAEELKNTIDSFSPDKDLLRVYDQIVELES